MTKWTRWRMQEHLSQAKFAKALGISLRTVKYIEAQRIRPSRRNRLAFRNLRQKYQEASTIHTGRTEW